MQKRYRTGRDVEKPQRRNVPTVAPMLDRRIHVVTWKRSIREPIAMQPKTEATLMAMRVNAAGKGEAPRYCWA